ncbi:MAG: methyltransferase family protein [Victivallaceae bacterium]
MMKLKPPVYMLTALVIMPVAHIQFPITRIIEFPWIFLGFVPLLSGVELIVHSLWLFKRRKTTAEPFGVPVTLVTSGPFRFSRNPMYVGILLIISGIACLFGTAGPWIVVPALGILFDIVFIRREEKRMERIFGDAYRTYKTQVRRWI